MARLWDAVSRRGLLKLLLALPLASVAERLRVRLFGWENEAAAAAVTMKVARISELKRPWDSARFTFNTKVKTTDVYNQETVEDLAVPGLVVRLSDEVAEKTGGEMKAKFAVLDLHCTHERCVAAFVANPKEARALADIEPKNPIIYCPCHRSVFDVAQGAKPVKGPAKEPLWKFNFDVKGDDIVVTGLDPKASMWAPGRAGGLTSEYPVRPGEPGL